VPPPPDLWLAEIDRHATRRFQVLISDVTGCSLLAH
jgi:hypothetical protein